MSYPEQEVNLKAVVIGGGFGGISSALRLRALGYEVSLYDKLDQLGGRARSFKIDGFHFDAGPTVVTASFLFEELFELFGKKCEDYIKFIDVDPWYRFQYADGSTFDYGPNLETTLKEIERIEPKDVENYKTLIQGSQKIFDIGFTQCADKPFHKLSEFLKLFPAMVSLRAYRNVYQFVSSYLVNEKLKKAFSIQPLLVGGNPFDTTCIYNLIHYLENKWGVQFAKGGMSGIVSGLEKLMHEEGITINVNSQVKRVVSEGDKITGIVLENDELVEADIFVSNADPAFLYSKMFDESQKRKWTPKKVDKLDYSMGLFVYYFGTKKLFPEVKHHTIVMGDSYEGLLKSIFEDKELRYDDMSLYLHRPSASDPMMAPDNHDCFYVLCPVPNLEGKQDWKNLKEEFRDLIVKKLEESILPGLKDSIVCEHILDPQDFQRDYQSYNGSGFSIAPKLTQSAYLRFHNKSEDFNNLFLCGAGTHPGAGLPGVLCSSKVVEALVKEKQLTDKKKIFKRNSKTFSFAANFFPAQEREQITRLYCILRKVDDLVDKEKKSELQKKEVLENLLNNRDLTSELERDVYTFTNHYPDSRGPLQSFLEAQVLDIEKIKIQDDQELLKYCYGVASTVGILSCSIFKVRNKNALFHAIDLGIAMQLTNICRDVLEDHEDHKYYLPSLSEDLFNEGKMGQIHNLRNEYLGKADLYYKSGFEGIRFLPFRVSLAVFFGGVLYQAIGDKIRQNEDSLRRASLSRAEKFYLVLKNIPSFCAHYFIRRLDHDDKLHRSINGLPNVHSL